MTMTKYKSCLSLWLWQSTILSLWVWLSISLHLWVSISLNLRLWLGQILSLSLSLSRLLYLSQVSAPIKMLLVFPLFIMFFFIIIIAYWNYDKYSDLRKGFNGYKTVVPDPFELKKHNFLIYSPSNSGKTTFMKDYSSLYKTVNVFFFWYQWEERI